MSRFYFGGSDDSGSEFDESNSNLPFPKPLSRSSFLAPDFDPAGFLSSLTDRHQTLEDLRTELRDLSNSLNKELVDLINSNYRDFLSLGSTLQGGDEKVEDVRVGLLGFQRDLGSVRDKVQKRRDEIAVLLEEKRNLKQEIHLGQNILELADRIDTLEEKLMIGAKQGVKGAEATKVRDDSDIASEEEAFDSLDESSGGEDDAQRDSLYLRRLERHIDLYLTIAALKTRFGPTHPFLAQQESRLTKIRSTLLMDLKTATKQARSSEGSSSQLERINRMYTKLGEQKEVISTI
ncbi:MAG: hypothetical protein Q9160_001901 [Pyrenula sp. 1 TL-2023]